MTARVSSTRKRSRADRAAKLKVERDPRGLTAEAIRATAAFRASLRRFEHTSAQIAREHGLTPQRYLLLLMIKGAADGSERSTVSELARRLQVAQHTATELVLRSERAGLLKRERSSEDGRVSFLALTEEGERRFALAFRDHRSERNALLKALHATEDPGDGG